MFSSKQLWKSFVLLSDDLKYVSLSSKMCCKFLEAKVQVLYSIRIPHRADRVTNAEILGTLLNKYLSVN